MFYVFTNEHIIADFFTLAADAEKQAKKIGGYYCTKQDCSSSEFAQVEQLKKDYDKKYS